jgi:hypothetical protein
MSNRIKVGFLIIVLLSLFLVRPRHPAYSQDDVSGRVSTDQLKAVQIPAKDLRAFPLVRPPVGTHAPLPPVGTHAPQPDASYRPMWILEGGAVLRSNGDVTGLDAVLRSQQLRSEIDDELKARSKNGYILESDVLFILLERLDQRLNAIDEELKKR